MTFVLFLNKLTFMSRSFRFVVDSTAVSNLNFNFQMSPRIKAHESLNYKNGMSVLVLLLSNLCLGYTEMPTSKHDIFLDQTFPSCWLIYYLYKSY